MQQPLTVDQVAQLLACADTTVRERARAGDLPGLKYGTDWVFPAGALFAHLDQLAIDEAADRRRATPSPASTPQATPRATLHAVPAPRSRRALPTLPTLPGPSAQPG